ncbi:hypothetical protein EDB84DRAFT_1580022 [Lactarius hengduanensis]|nr:hypothetical protein EDB84DRAFT_1580022 [Lactarius hengduanensis]
MRRVNPFSCGAMASQIPSVNRIRIAKSQGSLSQPVTVEMAVIRARNVPYIKTTFGGKRESFLTIAHGATAKKTKKQSKKRTKSVHIDGRTAVWDQMLDAFFLQPSSRPILRLYAKRSRKCDILSRTHETVIPTEFESDICFVLGHVNGQAEHSSWVTSVAFSPDGQRIVSGCFDRTNRLMNATTGDTEADPIHTDSVGPWHSRKMASGSSQARKIEQFMCGTPRRETRGQAHLLDADAIQYGYAHI